MPCDVRDGAGVGSDVLILENKKYVGQRKGNGVVENELNAGVCVCVCVCESQDKEHCYQSEESRVGGVRGRRWREA
jgi:hypothetical protein